VRLSVFVCETFYMVLMIFLDQIRLTVDEHEVRAKHRPLMLGNCTVRRDEVVRVDCEAAFYSRDKPDDKFADYHVRLVRHNGTETTLVTLRRDLAFYVANMVENYLHNDEIPSDVDDDEEDHETLMLVAAAEEDTAEAHSAK
jgi:hypothetical protein